MKIYKSKDFPTKNKFLAACESYQHYYRLSQRGENYKPKFFHSLVRKYVYIMLLAARRDQDPESVEFIQLTENESKTVKAKEDSQKKQVERLINSEELAAAARKDNLKKAAKDPEFRKEFIRAEMSQAGFTVETIVDQMANERWDGDRDQSFVINRKKTLQSIENEIKQYS